MIETVLKNTAYCYYPKKINSFLEKNKYINSNEFLKLYDTIQSLEKSDVLIELSKCLSKKKFKERSVFSILDRSYSFQFHEIIDNKIVAICLNISILLPIYSIYLLEVEIDPITSKWLGYPKEIELIDNIKHKKIIIEISKIIEKKINYFTIPKKLENTIIENISFQDIEFGQFTFFNAFFIDEKNIRI